jgi:hypothetical protein
MGFHPEPWHEKDHLNNILKRKVAPAGVAAASADAWNIRSVTPA